MKETMKDFQRILVTGGAGFIASHVVDAYIELGHQVLVVDNLSSGDKANLNSQAEFIKADITNREEITQIIQDFKPQIINHHAAHILVGNSVANPQFDAQVNILGVLNIMEAAKEINLKKIIFASTGGAIYGDKPTPFSEDMIEQPLSPYGVSKKAAELYLHYYFTQYGIDYLILRYSNVYGPRQNPHGESGVVAIFSDLIHKGEQPVINGDGTHTRDYVYVKDVAKANVLALETDFCGPINIGTQTEISTNEVFDKIAQEFGVKLEKNYTKERPGEQITSSLTYQRAKEVLGWEPTVNFDQGIKETIEWYQQKS